MLCAPRFAHEALSGIRHMVQFRRRFFPERRYRLPLRWVFLVLAAGLVVLILWVMKSLL